MDSVEVTEEEKKASANRSEIAVPVATLGVAGIATGTAISLTKRRISYV